MLGMKFNFRLLAKPRAGNGDENKIRWSRARY
jgi:hypothetical protein